jgi:alkaline phosphatase
MKAHGLRRQAPMCRKEYFQSRKPQLTGHQIFLVIWYRIQGISSFINVKKAIADLFVVAFFFNFMDMKSIIFLLYILSFSVYSQKYNSTRIFAHNDYVQPNPFYNAYSLQVGYIEADVFLSDGKLLVAHTASEMDSNKTLEKLYLEPLLSETQKNSGYAYADKKKALTLMIDIKTEGASTLAQIVNSIKHFQTLLSCKNLSIMISGNVPPPNTWKNYPEFIHFDGRPGIDYTADELKRVAMISTNFNAVSDWDGTGKLSASQKQKIKAFMDEGHAKGKPVRFWASPDFEKAWRELMALDADVIVTDNVELLARTIGSK